jgi:undecaprenyl pyrophosphate phosphatase UppP
MPTPTAAKGGPKPDGLDAARATSRRQFVGMALQMTWQLAVAVLVPVIGGVELDKALNTNLVFTLIGLAVALLCSGLVMWHAMQVANRLPVPKLTAAQKRAIQKSYEEDDD